jgi:hypothetical protein
MLHTDLSQVSCRIIHYLGATLSLLVFYSNLQAMKAQIVSWSLTGTYASFPVNFIHFKPALMGKLFSLESRICHVVMSPFSRFHRFCPKKTEMLLLAESMLLPLYTTQ